jgi:hypothetical protein
MKNSRPYITIAATHVVHGLHPITVQDPFILGPFEQLGHFATPVSAVWIYESSSNDFIPLEKLHKAVSRLLDYYPRLTGRLHIDPDSDVRTMTRLGRGIHLLEAYCDDLLHSFARDSSTGPELSIFDFPRYGNALLAPWVLSLEGAQREPVLKIQRTQFACVAVSIGMTLSHVVSGAGGFLRLYQDLAEIYRAIGPEAIRAQAEIQLPSPPHLEPFKVSQMMPMDSEEWEQALSDRPGGYLLRDEEPAPEPESEPEPETGKNVPG